MTYMEEEIVNNTVTENSNQGSSLVERMGAFNRSTSPMVDLTQKAYDSTMDRALPIDDYYMESVENEGDHNARERNKNLWITDAWSTLLNERDNINLMSERGELIKDVLPVIEDINFELGYLDLKKQINEISNSLTAAQVGSKEYNARYAYLQELNLQKAGMQEKYDSLLKHYGEEEGSDIDERMEALLNAKQGQEERANAIKSNISELNKSLQERSEREGANLFGSKVSGKYQREEQAAHDASIFDRAYWKYAVPGITGSSMATLESYAYSAAAAGVASLGRHYATTSIANLNPIMNAMGWASAIGATALNVYGNYTSRDRESLAQAYGAGKGKIEQDLKEKYGIDLNALSGQAREKFRSQNPGIDDTKISDQEMIDRAITGEINLDIPELNTAKTGVKDGLNQVYWNNMALSIGDVAESALIFAPLGKAMGKVITAPVKPLIKPITSAVNKVSSPTIKKINDVLTNTIDFGSRMSYKKPILAAAAKSAKSLAKIGFVAGGEAMEEGIQNVYDFDYLKGQYDKKDVGFWNSLLNYGDASVRTAKIITGIDSESELANDPQFYNDLKGGFALGLLFGGPISATGSAKQIKKDYIANKFVRDMVADNIGKKDQMNKSTVYSDKAIKNKQDEVLTVLESLKKNLPEGVTEEDLDAEIATAKHTMNIANATNTKNVAKAAGIVRGTNEYNTLVGLQSVSQTNLQEAIINSENEKATNEKVYDNAINSNDLLSFPVEDRATLVTLSRLNIEKQALLELQESLKKPETELNRIGITNSEIGTNLSQNIVKSIDRLTELSEQLTKDTGYDIDLNVLPSLEESGKQSFLRSLISSVDAEIAGNKYRELFGIKVSENNESISINKLSKEERDKAGRKILDRVNEYINNSSISSDIAAENAQSVVNNSSGIAASSTNAEPQISEPTVNKSIMNPDVMDDGIELSFEEELEPIKKQIAPETIEESIPVKPKKENKQVAPAIDDLDDASFTRASAEQESGMLYDERGNVASSSIANKAVQKNGMPVDQSKPLPTKPAETITEKVKLSDELIDKEELLNKLESMSTSEKNELIDDFLDIYSNMGNAAYDKVSHTMFYLPTSDTPILKGYKTGKELSELLMQPRILEELQFEFIVQSDTRDGALAFDSTNPFTFKDAAIFIVIKHGNNKYLAALKTPADANRMLSSISKKRAKTDEELKDRSRQDSEAIERLVDYRNAIINAFITKKDDEIVAPSSIVRTNGLFNENRSGKNVTFRPLQTIKGFEIPSDPYEMTPDRVTIGIGKGVVGNHAITGHNGSAMPGKGGSGQIFIYPKPSQTPSGKLTPIQINVQRFTSPLADYIAHLVTDFGGDLNNTLTFEGKETFIPVSEIINFLTRFGEDTIVDPQNYSGLHFLVSKQFAVVDGNLILGNNTYNLSTLTPSQKDEISQYITSMHWRINKDDIFKTIGDAVPSVKRWFLENPSKEVLSLGPLRFNRDEFFGKPTSMPTLGWYMKNNLFHSDLNDILFKSSFMYADGVEIIRNEPKSNTGNIAAIPESIQVPEPQQETTKQIELTSPDIDKNPYKPGDDPLTEGWDDFGLPKLIVEEYSETINEEETKWLHSKLGLSNKEVIMQDLPIMLGGNLQAMGLTRSDSIILFTGAEVGTAFHEAFHRVSTLILSPRERQQIYEAYRKKTGFKGTNKQLEENLAEEFKNYKLSESPSDDYRITKFFKNVFSFIKKWAWFTDTTIDNIFSRINSGYFSNKKINNESLEEFKNNYRDGVPFRMKGYKFQHITAPQFREIVKSLTAQLFMLNQVKYAKDATNLDFNKLYYALSPEITNANKKLTESQKDIRNEIFSTFERIFKPEIEANLKSYSLRAINRTDDIDAQNEQKASGEGVADAMQQYILPATEISKKDNALGSVKVFIATIPKITFKDGDYTKPQRVQSAATGLYLMNDFNKTWNIVLNNLHDCNNFNELISKSKELSKTIPFFYAFSVKLEKLTKVDGTTEEEKNRIRNSNELMQTQLINTIRSAYHNMVGIMSEAGTDANGNPTNSLSVRDANVSRASREYPIAWNFMLLNNPELFTKEGNKLIPIKSEIKKIITSIYGDKSGKKGEWKLGLADRALDAIINPTKTVGKDNTPQLEYWRQNLAEAKRNVLNKLADVGVTIDMETLNEVIRQDYYNEDPVAAFADFLNSERDGGIKSLFTSVLEAVSNVQESGSLHIGKRTVNITEAYKTLPILRKLAEIHASFNPSAEELSILSTDGKLLYPISEHNYLSDTIQTLNNDPELIVNLSKVLYNYGNNGKGSLLLEELSKGGKLKYNTMVYFKQSNSTDKGRKYTEISPLEDYVAKMAFTASNHIVLPTMGDSAMYNTISGSAVKLIHKPLMVSNTTIMFDANILDRFINYFLAELDTIEFNYNNENKINKDNAVKNYDTGSRNGYRFRYFNGFYKVKQATIAGIEPTIDFTNFNEALSLAEDLDDVYDTKEDRIEVKRVIKQIRNDFMSFDQQQKYSMMNKYVMDLFKLEIAHASTLGLVEWDGSKLSSVKNLALDDNRLDAARKHYSSSKNEVTKNHSNALGALEVLSDYFVNTIISVEEFEKLFIKDPAYYKDATDKIKRIREVLSTGVSPRTEFEVGNPMNDLTEVNVAMFADNEIPSPDLDKIAKYATRAASIELLKTMRDVTEEVATNLVDSGEIETEAYTDVLSAAKIKVNKDFGGYSEVNQTDATVLISPTMYEQLVRRIDGWTEEVRIAFELLNDPNGNWENNKEEYIAALGTTMKPLKCMYFGDHFDASLKRDIPIFDKMAMFPVHRIFSTGDMKVLLDIMEDPNKPVHMVAFESAVKVGQYSKTKFYTDETNSEINLEGLKSIPVHKQSFKHFRRQLITDPHHADRQMFVTQAQKAAMGNLRMDRLYTTPGGVVNTGDKVKNNIISAWNALTGKGKNRIEESFGVTENEDGTYSLDMEKFAGNISKDALSSGMNQNVVEGMEVKDGKLVSPLSGLSDNNWIESRIISTCNKDIIDIKLPGGMFIQMSSFAYNRIATTSDKNTKRQLNLVNDDGSMDCVVSINLLKHIIPGYDKMTFTEAKDWLVTHNVVGDKAKAIAMGYRIPAQGQSSMAALKVVDVWPEQIGDTITLPDSFTKLTGSDFDIDKLFIARYNYDKTGNIVKFITKDDYIQNLKTKGLDDETIVRKAYEKFANKTEFDANSREANENMLLDMYLSVLTNMNNFLETKTPLDTGTDVLKKEILKEVDELSGGKKSVTSSPLYYLTPRFQSKVKEELNGGKNGIAPFALAAAHHVITQLVNLEFSGSDILAVYGIKNVSGILGKDGKRILDWLSAMINAHVDVAKDPYIIRLNVRKWTFNMTNLLLRSGIGDTTFYYLPQQILKDMAVESDKYEGVFNIPKNKKAADAINQIFEKYKKEAIKLAVGPSQIELANNLMTKKGERTNVFDKQFLKEQLVKKNTFEWHYNQMRIYKAFDDLSPFAKDLNELVTLSQIDTKKFGNNFGLQEAFLYRWKNFMSSNTSFDKVGKVFTDTFLYKKMEDGIMFPLKFMSGILLRTTTPFVNRRTLLFSLTNGLGSKDTTYINNITKGLEASFKSSFFNKHMSDNNLNLFDMLYGSHSIPNRLDNLKKRINEGVYPELLDSDGGLSNALINSISQKLKITELDKQSPDSLVYKAIKSGDGSIDDDMIRAWDELLDSSYPEVKKFAQDLVPYAFFTSGDNFGPNSIFSFVPNSYREEIGYFDFIRGLENNPQALTEMLPLSSFFENMWWNDNIVPLVDLNVYSFNNLTGTTDISEVQGIWSKKQVMLEDQFYSYPYMFINENATPKDILGVNGMKQKIYPPYVKVKLNKSNDPRAVMLYKFVGNFGNKPVYILQNKKGFNNAGSVVVEFGKSVSNIPFNNLASNNALTLDKILNFGLTKGNEEESDLATRLLNNEGDSLMTIVTDYKLKNEVLTNDVFEGIEELVSRNVVKPTQIAKEVDTPIPTTINIYYGSGENAELSNFAYRPFTITNTGNELDGPVSGKFNTVEGAFQAQKLHYANALTDDVYKEFLDQLQTASGAYAKRLGSKIPKLDVVSWDSVKMGLMRNMMLESFRQNPGALQKLLDTGGSVITHTQDKGEWGTEFPRLLTEIRQGLAAPIVEELSQVLPTEKEGVSATPGIRKTYKGMIDSLNDNQIFVFGSNTQGRHGKGAALTARTKFGAIYGQSEGAQGSSYAIVTKDLTKQNHPSVSAQQIKENIERLYNYATLNSNKEFLIAYSGIGKNLNGYSNEEMASMFASLTIPDNIVFEEDFNTLVNKFEISEQVVEKQSNIESPKPVAIVPAQSEITFTEITKPVVISKDNTFRFSNGYTVTTPFVLNEEQKYALIKLEEFINGKESEITLSGYAGTGKTTILGIFDKYLASKGIKPFYSSPTHRANAVTKMNNPNTSVLTLHSVFGLSPEIKFEEGNYSLRDLEMAQRNKVKINIGDILIIDEASMVSKSLYDYIKLAISKMGITVIYVGDKGQLKPVKDEVVSPVFAQNNTQQIMLTKVERTGNNPILKEATALRQGNTLSYSSSVNQTGEGVVYSNDDESLEEYIKSAVLSEEYKKNKLYFKALSALNAGLSGLNSRVRSILFGNRPSQIEVGDVLMGYDNFGVDYKTGEAKIINSGDYEVLSVKPKISAVKLQNPANLETLETLELNCFTVSLQNLLNSNASPFTITVVNNSESNQKIGKIKDNVNALNLKGGSLRSISPRIAAQYFQAAREVSSQVVFMKNIEDAQGNLKIKKTLDYGYAITIHKSQGGTYNKTLVLDDTIDRFRGSKLDKQQLRYVAVSRASEFVFVATAEKLNPTTENVMETEDDFDDLSFVRATKEQEQKFGGDTDLEELSRLGANRKKECE